MIRITKQQRRYLRRAGIRQTAASQLIARVARDKATRVVLALEEVVRGGADPVDPIMEQLRQCPEAFKVGEILGRAFDSLIHAQDEEVFGHRYLPPSGVVVPPFV
jgi:hypothetical protein